MKNSEFIIRARRRWGELYNQTKNATLVRHRCGISATTIRKWRRRIETEGEADLLSKSKCLPHSPNAKIEFYATIDNSDPELKEKLKKTFEIITQKSLFISVKMVGAR